ncbi:hypothetical protein DFH27DRAFT_618136 [Peziza echinospora]|nr:hypothetical protein DFH27DRAFT_618136 [Peziza echinospora]
MTKRADQPSVGIGKVSPLLSVLLLLLPLFHLILVFVIVIALFLFLGIAPLGLNDQGSHNGRGMAVTGAVALDTQRTKHQERRRQQPHPPAKAVTK